MRYLYLFQSELCGEGTSDENLPNGYSAIACPEDLAEVPLERLYYKNDGIKLKGEAENQNQRWDENAESWVEIPPQSPPLSLWGDRIASLRASEFWGLLREGAERTIKAQAAWSELYGVLIAEHNEAALGAALELMIAQLSPQLSPTKQAELKDLLRI
jgi:hypothetical protein